MPHKRVPKNGDNGDEVRTLVVVEPEQPGEPQSDREVPRQLAIMRFEDVIQHVVNVEQFKVLRGKTPAYAIRQREGPGGKMLRYIPHGYARDQLNKAFGFDWDFEILPTFSGRCYDMVDREEFSGKAGGDRRVAHHLVVHGQMTVRIRNPGDVSQILTVITKSDFGSAVWRDTVEFGDALKAASSDALKRCALGLGVGADLYYDDDTQQARYNEALAKTAAIAEALANPAVPTSLPMFIARAMQEYGLDAAELTLKIGVSINQLGEQFPDHAEAMWQLLAEKMTAV